jgi:ribosomal-protein-alanine N-acetyltransferase
MIGTVGFTSFDFNNNSAEIGYVLNRRFWHNGIESEAVRRIIVFAFEELHLDKLVAKYMLENQASLRVAKAVGMIEVVGKKENIFFKETSIDIGTVELTKEAYLNNKRNF